MKDSYTKKEIEVGVMLELYEAGQRIEKVGITPTVALYACMAAMGVQHGTPEAVIAQLTEAVYSLANNCPAVFPGKGKTGAED